MNSLLLKDTLIKNSTFQNFDLIYCTMQLEMYNVTFSFNVLEI